MMSMRMRMLNPRPRTLRGLKRESCRWQEEATWQDEDEDLDVEPSPLDDAGFEEEGMDAEGGPAGDPDAGAGASGAAAGPPRADPAYIQMFLLKCGPAWVACTKCSWTISL